jgi:hypothetical protein
MPRTEQQMVKENIELSAEFSRYLFDNPELEDQIPPDSEIVFLTEFDQELKSFNLSLGKRLEAEGNKIAYVTIGELKPKTLSRIEGVDINLRAAV